MRHVNLYKGVIYNVKCSEIILVCYVAVILPRKDFCFANLKFKAHN